MILFDELKKELSELEIELQKRIQSFHDKHEVSIKLELQSIPVGTHDAPRKELYNLTLRARI